MPYTQEISRQNKACFLFLLDQSYSMTEPLANSQRSKMQELVLAINSWLQNAVIRATGSTPDHRRPSPPTRQIES